MQQEAIVSLLRSVLDLSTPATAGKPDAQHPWKGRYVLVRCRDAGVHAGVLEHAQDRTVRLSQSRRLWQWRVPMGAPSFLSGVATHGLDHAHSKVGVSIEVELTEVCEIIPCSKTAESHIKLAPEVARVQ